uniref:Uncharacterized protein n=1 Tax=Caulerpa lentillifera TaxID=148947 RepID=A0A2Z2QKK8_9CHLO|nr:hypothetical protein [Caulerpa lentillifera]AST24272.1 hypothetical protein [Caulerpa lentillifera]
MKMPSYAGGGFVRTVLEAKRDVPEGSCGRVMALLSELRGGLAPAEGAPKALCGSLLKAEVSGFGAVGPRTKARFSCCERPSKKRLKGLRLRKGHNFGAPSPGRVGLRKPWACLTPAHATLRRFSLKAKRQTRTALAGPKGRRQGLNCFARARSPPEDALLRLG